MSVPTSSTGTIGNGVISKGTWALFALIIAVLVAVFVTNAVVGPRETPAVISRYSHAQLQSDADMTQQMSVPGASGPMSDGSLVDDQLRRAQQDPTYLAQLEAHQRQIDQMLARAPR